jgi:hypothetical protein
MNESDENLRNAQFSMHKSVEVCKSEITPSPVMCVYPEHRSQSGFTEKGMQIDDVRTNDPNLPVHRNSQTWGHCPQTFSQ